jgi:vancomycin resistance protein YoaR
VGFATDKVEAVRTAVNYGKDGGTMSKVKNYFKCKKEVTDIETQGTFDEEAVRQKIAETAKLVDVEASDRQYTISDTAITIVKGSSGYVVDEDAVYDYIYTIFTENTKGNFETDEFSDKYNTVSGDSGINLQAIYNEIYVEPVNAVVDVATGTTTTEGVTGISFDLEKAQAEYEALQDGETMTIDLIFTEPETVKETDESLYFRDKLSEKSTTLSTSSSNRITNVTLAAAACNDTVLQPGETFSFNGTLGERTAAKGYKEAGAYVAGETVDQIGGGICQVSSTLYYCVLMADLKITSRTNHMYSVAYLPLGFDATVNWGTIDFKFTNDSDYPVKIVAYVENKQLYMEIWGTKVNDNKVELKYEVVKTVDYETVEKEDESIAQGKSSVKTSGHNGYVVDNYQLIYDGDGNLLENNYLGRSTYRSQNRVVLVAPKTTQVETTTTTTTTENTGNTENTGSTGSTGNTGTSTETENTEENEKTPGNTDDNTTSSENTQTPGDTSTDTSETTNTGSETQTENGSFATSAQSEETQTSSEQAQE